MSAEDNVTDLPVVTTLDLNPDRVLAQAQGECPEGVVVVGWDADGELYFASSLADGGSVLWLFEHAKRELLKEPEE